MSVIKENKAQISKKSFEEAMNELENIVNKMEDGEMNLEDSIKNYEYATALREYLDKKLADAKLKIEKISN